MWSSKALFGADQESGWVISDGVIKANYIRISSSDQSIIIASKTSLSTNGIVLRATGDTGYAISAGNISDPSIAPFSVTTKGDLFAQNATIIGTIKAKLGGFGYYNPTTAALVNGWDVTGDTTSASITATGTALINLSSGGSIKVGNFEISSDSNSSFRIMDITNPLSPISLFKTELVAGTTIKRIFLGQEGRQVEVAKNAEISGGYTDSEQDRRSGGLRNMFTITEGQYNSSVFPSASSGSVLLVYDPDS
jgi:hypothetical protein